MDEKAGLERAAVKAWTEAVEALRVGVLDAASTLAAFNTADGMNTTLQTAKEDAETAVSAVNTQIAEETLAREYLYCELGGNMVSNTNVWLETANTSDAQNAAWFKELT